MITKWHRFYEANTANSARAIRMPRVGEIGTHRRIARWELGEWFASPSHAADLDPFLSGGHGRDGSQYSPAVPEL